MSSQDKQLPRSSQRGVIFQRLVLAAGIILGISFILYSLAAAILVLGYISNVLEASPSTKIPASISLFVLGVLMLLPLGVTLMKLAFDIFRARLSKATIILASVFGSLYLLLQGGTLLAIASEIGNGLPLTVATLDNDASLIIAAAILILVAAPLLLQKSQAARILGACFAVTIAVLSSLYINSELSTAGRSGQSFATALSNGVSLNSSTLPVAGLFLSTYWAEISAMIIGSVGLLAWAVLSHRREVLYALVVAVASFIVYGIGLAIVGFQDSIYLFNSANQIADSSRLPSGSSTATFIALLPSRLDFLAVSFLLAGIAGIVTIAASAVGIWIRVRALSLPERVAVSPIIGSGASFCSSCGTPARTEDQFCRSCGRAL